MSSVFCAREFVKFYVCVCVRVNMWKCLVCLFRVFCIRVVSCVIRSVCVYCGCIIVFDCERMIVRVFIRFCLRV